MTRLSEKLRLSLFLYNPTRFLSPKHLAHFSVSTLHLCKSLARALASKTLALFTMDDPFAFTPDDNDGWDFDLQSRNRAQRPRLLEDYDEDDDVSDNAVDKVYLVPYRCARPSLRLASLRYSLSLPCIAINHFLLALLSISGGGRRFEPKTIIKKGSCTLPRRRKTMPPRKFY